jgi:Lon protease-like protein
MLKGEWESDYHAFPDIFEIGCAGKITAIQRLPDGRFNLTLEGLSEFRVIREVRERAYRQARIEWCPAPCGDLRLDDRAMANLRELLVSYLGPPAVEVWRSLVDERGLRDADLINLIAFHLDIPALEKQTLLEARGARVSCLLDVITFKLEERKLGPGSSGSSGLVQ